MGDTTASAAGAAAQPSTPLGVVKVELCTEKPKLSEFVEPLTKAGGPMQYLCNKYPSDELQRQLGGRLNEFFKHDGIQYSSKSDLVSDEACNVLAPKELIYKLSDLGIASICTPKGAPRLHTSLKLADDILSGGFVTIGDDLKAFPNPATQDHEYFWLSWVKGHQRACTAVSMAEILMEKYQVPGALFDLEPELFYSFQHVRVRNANIPPGAMSVAFNNARLSYRGSIRDALDVIGWLQVLAKLSVATGLAGEAIIKKLIAGVPRRQRSKETNARAASIC